jgi:hypothetical protein
MVGRAFMKYIRWTLRLTITPVVVWWYWGTAIVGQTMQPDLPFGTALPYCMFLGFPFAVVVLMPLWGIRPGFKAAAWMIPVLTVTAFVAASAEERLFVSRYSKTGIGPTSRWTVSNHWLAYDADKQRLYGAD